jgi:hypothetical protein
MITLAVALPLLLAAAVAWRQPPPIQPSMPPGVTR